ncbi:MAG: UDP-N-acetylglucosamine--N-acetylmuramyl-(pentapeptide) pyrophosphoryl-undecaprenol N-acetylglucosamine transferase [Patescibacteria group bacterium]
MKKIRILLVGGGSGGHIYPLIAVAQKIRYFAGTDSGNHLDLRYFGDAGGYEDLIKENGIKYSYVISSKLRRYFSFENFIDFFKFFIAIFQSLFKVFFFMPSVVFSKGGPGSLPILFVCKFFAVPIVIHESDSVPGLANLISGKMSKKIFLAFESAKRYFPNKNIGVVGNPIRNELIMGKGDSSAVITEIEQKEAKKQFDFNQERPVLLILGGSQGAVIINNFVIKNIEFLAVKFQILHQIGLDNFDEYKKDYDFLSQTLPDSIKNNYKFYPYLENNLKSAYIAADLILARAGAGTIFEIAYFGKPSILIPLPDAANDHQVLNAIEFEESGATIDIEQENFLSHLVLVQLETLISKTEILKKMSKSASVFYRPFSSETIAAHLLSFAGLNIYPDNAPIKEMLLK